MAEALIPPQPSCYVIADEATGLIRRWILTRDIDLQEYRDDEIIVEVTRQPNLLFDKYVDLISGKMRSTET